MPDELWQRLGEVAQAAGTDRANVIRALIRWYIREPGAKLPNRP
jgi:metal-responsive CopG/Arc/MetJ family transcriptional regulator